MSYRKELRKKEFTQIGPWSSEQYNFQNVHLLFKHPVETKVSRYLPILYINTYSKPLIIPGLNFKKLELDTVDPRFKQFRFKGFTLFKQQISADRFSLK